MKSNKSNTKTQKQMKMVEAGVLFALILGLTIFVGIRFAPEKDISEIGSEVVVSEVFVTEEVNIPEPEIVQEPKEEIAISETETTIVEPTALEVEPPRIVTYASAEKAYFEGDYEDAAAQFSEYTKDHSANAWGFYMLGLAELKAGDEEGSEIAFLSALNIKPDHVKSLVNYGRLLLKLDRIEEARTAATEGSLTKFRMYSLVERPLMPLSMAHSPTA